MSPSIKINWKHFSIKNENQTEAFEVLCYHLFCRAHKLSDGVRVDYNQVGLETYPVTDKNGDLTGFQSKFFDNKLSDASSVNQINDSVKKAKKNYPGLKRIVIYTHQSFGSKDPQYKKDMEALAHPVKLDWFVGSNFEATLFKPSNLDLAQLYFGLGTEISFLKDTLQPAVNTFLSSALYIHLPLLTFSGKNIKNTKDYILKSSGKEFIIIGNPGSGKTISIYKLFQELSGLHKANNAAMITQLTTQKAIPVLINLRNCNTDSIENVIRGRQIDNQIKGRSLNFIYLFDGLDELTEDKAEDALSFILELRHKSDTDRIIFSCRSGSLNRLKAKAYFTKIEELKIAELNEQHIDSYFFVRSDAQRTLKLTQLKLTNPGLIKDIHDILLLNLLWETVDLLDSSSTVMDLLAQKIDLLINSPKHKKNLDALNLLNPKEAKVIRLHEEIAYEFQKKFQFRFALKELQQLVIKECQIQDSISVNNIVNYLCSLFFDYSHADNSVDESYVYQHRRYQEYFFAKKLRWEYERNPGVLRQLNVISNSDFFEDFFLLLLKQAYKKENNLIGLIELNLIDVYLGKHSGWGSDNAYYLDSEDFIISVAGQTENVFEQLVHDENLGLKDKISLGMIEKEELETLFQKFNSDKKDSDTEQHLRYIWEKDIARLINLVAILHQNGKVEMALEMKLKIGDILGIYQNHKFSNYSKRESPYGQLTDPFWDSWESYLYNLIIINGEPINTVYRDRILGNYKYFKDDESFSYEESGKDKLIKSFLRVAVGYRLTLLIPVIKEFNSYELSRLFSILTETKYLPFFYKYKEFHQAIHERLKFLFENNSVSDLNVLFFKKTEGLPISKDEILYLEKTWEALREQSEFDLQRRNQLKEFALTSYIQNIYHFGLFLEKPDKGFNYYYETGLYATLFHDYVLFLKGEKDIQTILRDYTQYIKLYTRSGGGHKYFTNQFSGIWASILYFSTIPVEKKKQLKELILSSNDNITRFDFNLALKYLDPGIATVLIFKEELDVHTEQLTKSNDNYPQYINRCFQLALLNAGVDDSTAIRYIAKGINDGILRHGWRKDPIVSYNLVYALDILWRNGWSTSPQLKLYSKKVFDLTMRVQIITDGKVTWRGPYNLIAVVARYDLPLAEKLRKKLIRKNHKYALSLNTSIIKAKINLGLPLQDIQEEINDSRHDYDHKGQLSSNYHLERFKIYLHVAASLLHSDSEQKEAFEMAYSEIEEMLHYEDYYVNWKNDLDDEAEVFKDLCRKYNKKYNIPEDNSDEKVKKKGIYRSEADIIGDLEKIKTKSKLSKWYADLRNSESGTVTTFEHWIIIVNKTYEISGNITPLLAIMKRDYFPHSDYFSHISPYYYLGLAAAIKNLNTKQQTLEYIMDNSGHAGFLHVMESYEVLRDEEMCCKLFERFINFCDFLVN
jgi:DNA polymerase III delta prime subunit